MAAPGEALVGASVKGRSVQDMVALMEDLERNYTDMLNMFMNTSRRMVDNAAFVEAMVEATKDVGNEDLRRVAAVRHRLQQSLSSVRDDFVKQTQQIVDSPLFSSKLKSKVRELREGTELLEERTRSGALYGGERRVVGGERRVVGGERRNAAGASGGDSRRHAPPLRRRRRP